MDAIEAAARSAALAWNTPIKSEAEAEAEPQPKHPSEPFNQRQPAFSEQQLIAARERITDGGQAIADWAKSKQLDLGMVYHMLQGRSRGVRGESYRVAVAMGLKNPSKAKAHGRSKPTQSPALQPIA